MFTKNNNNMSPTPKRDKNQIFAIIFAFLIILWTVASVCSISTCARTNRKGSSSTITASAQSIGDYNSDTFRIDLPMLNTITIKEEGFGNVFTCSSRFQLVLADSYVGITRGTSEYELIPNSTPISYSLTWEYGGAYLPMTSNITFSSSQEPLPSIFREWAVIEVKYEPLLTSSSIDYSFDIEFTKGSLKRVYSFNCSVALPTMSTLNEVNFNPTRDPLPLGHYVWDEEALNTNNTSFSDLVTSGFKFYPGDSFYGSTYFVGINYRGDSLRYEYAPSTGELPELVWSNGDYWGHFSQDFYIFYFSDDVVRESYELICQFAHFEIGTILSADIGPSAITLYSGVPQAIPLSSSAMGLSVAEGSTLYFSSSGTSGSLSYNEGYSAGYTAGKTDWFNAGKAEGYEVGKTDGIAIGREEGLEEGKDIGYANGLVAGEQTGFDKGYTKGVADSNEYTFMGLFSSVIDAPVQAFTGLFNFDLLGINLSGFFLALLTAGVCLAILRLII